MLPALVDQAPAARPPEPERVVGQRLELQVDFSPAAPLSVSAAPFDLFIFRAGDFGHQIRFPQYMGTQQMRALFNTEEDRSTDGRRFVHGTGVPAALLLGGATTDPLEGVRIHEHFPEIVTFAATAGAQGTNFHSVGVVAARGRGVGSVVIPMLQVDTSRATAFDAQLAWSSSLRPPHRGGGGAGEVAHARASEVAREGIGGVGHAIAVGVLRECRGDGGEGEQGHADELRSEGRDQHLPGLSRGARLCQTGDNSDGRNVDAWPGRWEATRASGPWTWWRRAPGPRGAGSSSPPAGGSRSGGGGGR